MSQEGREGRREGGRWAEPGFSGGTPLPSTFTIFKTLPSSLVSSGLYQTHDKGQHRTVVRIPRELVGH